MKKSGFIVIALLFSQLAFCQLPFTAGPKVGANFSSLRSTNPDQRISTENIIGWAFGGFARASIGTFYVQPEAYFNEQGSNLRIWQSPDPGTPNGAGTEGRVRLTTLDIPLLFGLRLIPLDAINVRLMAGPVYTRVVSERINDLRLLNPATYQFNRDNLGLQGEVGADFTNFTFDVRYQTGLGTINGFDQRVSLFHVALGYKLF
jgi:hypothetical protein